MSSDFQFPETKGAIFWPVGTGDSTTLLLKPREIVMQIDLHHLEKADNADEPEWPIVDNLVRLLPQRNGRPYLAAFVLTHPDMDHIRGFAELLKRVDIGELWHTPKIFRDHEDEGICEDAIAFRDEAHRRREAILRNSTNIQSGNRLRVVGHDDILSEDKYKALPDSCKSRPGETLQVIDGIDLTGLFQTFIHAPFKDDQAASRNNTSLSLNIVLIEGDKYGQFFFFGDREYPTITQIIETTEQHSNEAYLYYDVMLSSHHCSKCVMYWQGEGDTDATLKQDIMDSFKKYARPGAFIVSSSHSDFTDGSGDNPPHQTARECYEDVVQAGHFICTHEYPSKENPWPLVFTVDEAGCHLLEARTNAERAPALAAAVTTARGSTQPPGVQVGFGSSK